MPEHNVFFEYNQENSTKRVALSSTGKVLVGITGGIAVGLTVICAPFVVPALRKYCLPYVPATNTQITNIFKALRQESGNLLDIGSGDGRIVLEAARHGFQSHGVELNPWLIIYSQINALRKGLFRQTKFFYKDLWKFNLKPYNNIVIFGVEQMMVDLEKKFLNECRSETKIVACRFPLPNLEPAKTVGSGIDTVWLYIIQKR